MEYDVVVVGAGNAAMCSALAAEEAGAKAVSYTHLTLPTTPYV